jgi:hypothetical protein
VGSRGPTPVWLGFGLSRELWLVEAGIFLNMLGYGAMLPFEVIYLHDGRGFSLGVAGVAAAAAVSALTLESRLPVAARFTPRPPTPRNKRHE